MYEVIVPDGRIVYRHANLNLIFKWLEDRGIKDFQIIRRDE